MKKLLLSLGALSAVVAPVAAVVACGSHHTDSKLDTIKKTAISSLDQFTGLSDEAKTTAINAINAAKDQTGVETALQVATTSTQPEAATGHQTPTVEFKNGAEFNAGTWKGLIDKFNLEEVNPASAEDASKQAKLLEGGYVIKSISHGLKGDKTHGDNDYIIVLENPNKGIQTHDEITDNTKGRAYDLSAFSGVWNQDTLDELAATTKDTIIVYVQDYGLHGIDVEIEVDVLAKIGTENKITDQGSAGETSEDSIDFRYTAKRA